MQTNNLELLTRNVILAAGYQSDNSFLKKLAIKIKNNSLKTS